MQPQNSHPHNTYPGFISNSLSRMLQPLSTKYTIKNHLVSSKKNFGFVNLNYHLYTKCFFFLLNKYAISNHSRGLMQNYCIYNKVVTTVLHQTLDLVLFHIFHLMSFIKLIFFFLSTQYIFYKILFVRYLLA